MSTHRSILRSLLACLVVGTLAVGCSSGSGSDGADTGASTDTTTAAGDADADPGDIGTEPDTDDFEGEPRGTVVIDGVSHDLALSDETGMAGCHVADGSASASLMQSDQGTEVFVSGSGEVWGAEVTTADDGFEAATQDPDVASTATFDAEPGHLVVEGGWVSATTGATTEIRLELFCPTS